MVSCVVETAGVKVDLKVKYLVILTVAVAALALLNASSQAAKPAAYIETVKTANDTEISFRMVPIPGGTFTMGSPDSEPNHQADEEPQHEVRLDPFYMCWTETTIELFMAYYQETVSAKRDFIETQEAKKDAEQADGIDAISGPTPVYGDLSMGYGPRHPAIGMTWHNANNFCLWLSKKTGKKYRLPTEAEWEYACRAGTSSVFGSTDDPEEMKDYAWYEVTADSETSEVGKKKRNAFGLYDMSGNVREWVSDFYSPTAYKDTAQKSPAVNPKGPKTGELHVARGGDYSCSLGELRCAARHLEQKWWRMGDPQIPKSIWWLPEMDIIGFRVARSVEAED
ncbi:MAG: SUMF1/EgtB/PvdO family nonheme iron enzyme [Phycisphaerae bacterium]|nr:SUMF1/EgtB/PvdO family nonheme iron enzyme [Phycisphaerae bacterium]